MSISSDIDEDASLLLDFMAGNIVLPTGTARAGSRPTDNLYWMRLVKGWCPDPVPNNPAKPAIGVIETTKVGCEVYFFDCLGYAGPGGIEKPDDSFKAYWVPYRENGIGTTTLGLGAAIALTAKMDGCSFGLGSNPGNGSCLAGHSNEKRKSGEGTFWSSMAQDVSQHVVLERAGITDFIDPGFYRRVGFTDQGTTFAIRTNSKWVVYVQCIARQSLSQPPTFVHRGVKEGIRQL